MLIIPGGVRWKNDQMECCRLCSKLELINLSSPLIPRAPRPTLFQYLTYLLVETNRQWNFLLLFYVRFNSAQTKVEQTQAFHSTEPEKCLQYDVVQFSETICEMLETEMGI